MMKRLHFLLLILLLNVACWSGLRSESIETALSDDTVIVYNRSGGFAGLQQEWKIYADGRIDLPNGSQKQVDVVQVQALFDTIRTADFQSLNESYIPEDSCCDLFTYTVTVQTGSEEKTITTMDDAPNVPAALTAVFQTINQLIQTVE